MPDKIDSYMICSQLDISTANQLQSTISFGKALQHQKISTRQTQLSSNYQSLTDLQIPIQQAPSSLMEIFHEFLHDPLSTYTLKLSSYGQTQHYIAQKTVNERYGKYITSIEREEFNDQLQSQDTLVYSQPSETPKVKLTKISSILKMIEEQKKSNKQSHNHKTNQEPHELIGSSQAIKIEDMDITNIDKRLPQKDVQLQKVQSEVFLQLESNLSSKCENFVQKLSFTNRKSQSKSNKNELLSPVPENPEKKIFKIKNSNHKTPSDTQSCKTIIQGLEFSKKLRKKTFNRRNTDKIRLINPFQIDS